MKKYILTVIAAALLCGLCSCGDTNGPEDLSLPDAPAPVTSASAPETTTAAETAVTSAATTTAATAATTAETTAAPAVTTVTPVKSDSVELDYTPEGADLAVFGYDANKAIVFSAPAEEQSDATLIAAAQALYQSAHATSFSIDCGLYPFRYKLDENITIPESELEGNMKMVPHYLVTDERVSSKADAIAEYYKLFSDRYPYPEMMDILFVEYDGRLYIMGNGAGRGSDIDYQGSEVISYNGRNGDELAFTVRDHYDATRFGGEKYDEDREFTAVIGSDGIWRAGKFTLPN